MPRSRILPSLAAAAAAIALVVVPALPAAAHAAVVDSTPGEGETLTSLPATFSVTANEDLLDVTGSASGFALQVVDAAGLHYETACPAVDGTVLSTPASIGAAGDYELRYQFVSADGHPVSGAIAFTWAPSGAAVAAEGTTESACRSGESPAPSGGGVASPVIWVLSIAGILLAAVAVVVIAMRRRRGTGS